MECLLDKEKNISKYLLSQNYERLQDDVENWDLVIFILGMQDEWTELINWAEKLYQREDADNRALYFYMIALREKGYWEKAIQITNYSLDRSRDQYYDELLIWNTFDCLLNQQTVMPYEELFEYIDAENLSSLSNYILTLIDALMTAQQGTFIDLYHEISPKLRMCQRAFAQNYGYKSLEEARKQTRLSLKQTINTSFFNGIFWNWRLSNHF